MNKERQYCCDLTYSGEGDASGYMYLTKSEYETVKRVVDTTNWNGFTDAGYSGRLYIYCAELERRYYGSEVACN